jgi:hypothetical protein
MTAEINNDRPLRVGDLLLGFCGGTFGSRSYFDKRVEAVGSDWVVVRESDGSPGFFAGDPEILREYRYKD